jgi:hypothetical protein
MIDWKALSVRRGHADVAFTMKQYCRPTARSATHSPPPWSTRKAATTCSATRNRRTLVYKQRAEDPSRDRKGPLTCYLVW